MQLRTAVLFIIIMLWSTGGQDGSEKKSYKASLWDKNTHSNRGIVKKHRAPVNGAKSLLAISQGCWLILLCQLAVWESPSMIFFS